MHMTEMYRGFYEILKEELANFNGKDAEEVKHLPDLLNLLCRLYDTDLSREQRRDISCALAYYVSPYDIIPEHIYGPSAYIDDVFVCCYVLNMFKDEHAEFYKEQWTGNGEVMEVLEKTYQHSLEAVNEPGLEESILEYAGLK